MAWHLLLLLVLPFSSQGCFTPASKVTVEPGAQVVIGAVLPVHRPGEGVFGCGPALREGVEAFEAMRWAVHVLNRKSGLISDGGGGSLIPGVKIGLQAYDSCGHEALAVEHITELFPVLRSGQRSCDFTSENSSLTIGVVDMNDLSHHPEVSASFRDYRIPSIELSFTTVIPPEKMAQVLHGAAKDLKWSNVIVLHEDEEYSISVAKQLTQLTATGGATCINSIHSLPKITASIKSNRRDLRTLRKLFRTVTSGIEDGSAFIVITKTDETTTRFLHVMSEFPEIVSKVQWLFSWIPPSSEVGGPLWSRLFSIAPFPERVQQFEEYWSDLRQMASFSNQEDQWFLEHFMAQKGCKVPGPVSPIYSNLPTCDDRDLAESPTDVLRRTSRVIPALTAIFTLATALHKAWETKCGGEPGLCQQLRATPREEFVDQYLEPVEYLVSAEAGPEGKGRVVREAEGGLKGSKLSLARYFYEEGKGVTFKQIIVYESQGSRVLDAEFETIPSRCTSSACRNCVRPRQSRLDDRLQDLDLAESFSLPQADIVLPLLVPLHSPGLSPLECGAALDPAAVQQLEAALWTVGRVNDDPASLAGARIGLAVVDTCSSPLLATQRLATFVAGTHLEPGAAMAIVSLASPEETLAATTVLRPLNISVVSTSDLLPFLGPEDRLGLDNHLFQVSSPVESQVLAAMDVFDRTGWRFVSLVFEDTPLSTVGHRAFLKVAKQRGVCVGQQFEMQHQDTTDTQVDKFMAMVAEAKRSQGSSVVVLLTSEEGTRRVLRSLGKLWEAGAASPGDLVLMGMGEWGEKLEVFRGLEKEALGSIVFKQETGEVSEFSSHYQRMLPDSNPLNPWFDELWQQSSGNDPPVQYRSSQTTTNTVQAIVAVTAGIASLRNQLCLVDPGLCPAMTQHPGLHHVLGEHISSVVSPRLDHPGQTFRFTTGGFGDTPIEVYNYRKFNGKDTNYLKVGTHDGHYNRLASMVTYTAAGGEAPLDSIPSLCTSDCHKCTSTSHFIAPSPQDIYIAAALGVHEPTANPLSCGALRPSSFQNLEALLWALDAINSDPSVLPGVRLGLVTFDTCDSKEKAAMDLSNFLSGAGESSLPAPENVLGFVVEGSKGVVQPLVDLTMPMGMATVASSVVAPEFGDVRKYSHLLKMSLPSNVVVSSFVSVLRYFHWKYVSVVYTDGSEDPLFGEEGFNELKAQMDSHGIDIAVSEKVGLQEKDLPSTMDIVVHRLKIKQNAGARAVILLLPPSLLNHLLSAVKRLQHVGRSRVGDFVWLSYEALEPFQMFPDQSVGALVLRQRSGDIPAFKKHFTHLHLNSYRRNPWFREYWEQMFNCRGSSCGQHQSLAEVGFTMDRSVPPTVNALFSLALALDSAHRQLCPAPSRNCDKRRLRERLFEATRKVRFTGLDGTPVVFGEKNYIKGTLEVFNFREVGEVRAFMQVGEVDETHGLSINTSLSRGYDERGEEVSLDFVPSLCNDSESCPRRGSEGVASFMKIPPNQEFVIGVMLPVHQPGDNYFVCSRVVDETAFQSLLALSFALEKVNENRSVLPQIKLGALVFDHCGRRQRAEEQIFSFIASDGSLPFSEAHLRSRAMVAALTLDPALADDLSPLFESALIPQIATPSTLTTPIAVEMQRRKRNSEEETEKKMEVRAIVDLLDSMNWKFVTVVHSGSSLFWDFLSLAKERKICVSASLRPDDIISEFAGEARVVVLLLDDPAVLQRALQAAREAQVLDRVAWVAMESGERALAKALQGEEADFFVIRPESHEVPGFRDYYSRFSLSEHSPLPDAWFEEFWQHRFGCHLPHSSLRHLYRAPCGGGERLALPPPTAAPVVHHTAAAVAALAEALHDYLRRYCAHGDAAASLDDCGPDARRLLWRETRRRMAAATLSAADCPDGDCGPIRMPQGFQVFQLKRGKMSHVYQQVGVWKDDKLSLKMEDVSFISGETVTSACRLECQKCMDQLSVDPEELNLIKPGLFANFGTLWGLVISALSILGVVLVLICASYFLVSFQVTVGTTVLGYMVLFGLLLLYAVNFAFVLAPSEGTCGVRRFGLGLAYAVVFSGMLVKVMNIWRTMGYHQHPLGDTTYHLTSPAALLVVAVGLVIIQVILSSAWLILIPPTTGMHAGEWRCHPATTFEDELVISLVYVMLMLAITILFSVLTWSSKDNNNESRWILTCCLLMSVVWVGWTVVSTQVLHSYRDLTISAANLACASVVMLCMYVRKVYLYQRLSRQEEKKARLKQSVPLPAVPNMYGTLSRPFAGPPVVQESLAPSRMALIAESEGGSDSGSGSTQVQAADLYPLDMYDGGSQFQPPSLSLPLHEHGG